MRAVQKLLQHNKILTKPPLTEAHKSARLDFARITMSWTSEWHKIIFFNMDGPDGFHYYWHDVRKEDLILSKRQMGGGFVMVWAAVGWRKKTEIVFCTNRMNSVEYLEILKTQILGKGQQFREWTFDNTSTHRSAKVKSWFEDQDSYLAKQVS
jgi:hypothetical protein